MVVAVDVCLRGDAGQQDRPTVLKSAVHHSWRTLCHFDIPRRAAGCSDRIVSDSYSFERNVQVRDSYGTEVISVLGGDIL